MKKEREYRKGFAILFSILLVFSLVPVFAQDEIDGEESYSSVPVVEGECPEDCWLNIGGSCTCPEVPEETHQEGPLDEYEKDYYKRYDEYEGPIEFNADAGSTPDDFFYFIDDFSEGVFIRDNPERALDYKEEKIAEAIVMIDEGNPVEAQRVLEKAIEYNDIIEEEVNPELEERIEESSMQVQYVLKEIKKELIEERDSCVNIGGREVMVMQGCEDGEKEIRTPDICKSCVCCVPEEWKGEWEGVIEKVDNTFEKEGKIRTAAEIATKINELCGELAALDPIQYEDTCKTDDNAPKWMKERNTEWSREQEQEARKFGKILGECFASSGRDCRCRDVSFYDFQVFCEKMSDLAVECDNGAETACIAMDSEEMPELPAHLEEIFYEVEEEFAKEKYGNEKFKPKECEGLNHKECMLVMIELKAPPECRIAIKEAVESGEIKGEKGARDICDKIMFEKHTPDECIEAGTRTPEECARLMMPQECIDAGITGEHKSDEIKCKELMKKGIYYGGGKCTQIEDVQQRLMCFEGAMRTIDDVYYKPEGEMPEGEMTWQCKENRIHWPPDCSRFMRDVWPQMQEQRERGLERTKLEREEYEQYRREPYRILCPDGVCDDWERNSGGCWVDCGDIEPGLAETQCGSGCYFDYYFNACECPVTSLDCGPGCWPEGNRCECSSGPDPQCGSGCWWDDYSNRCECAGMTCPDGSYSENGMCGPVNQGCWCGSVWSANCNCGPVSAGCQCSWGWSPDCRCDIGQPTACSPGCWWEIDHCECGERTVCSPGCWWDDYYKSCQCSVIETCSSSLFATGSGACNYAKCPNGCHFDYQGCPDSCIIAGGRTCPDGFYSNDGNCAGHEESYGCQCSWGWSNTCQCGNNVLASCSSKGGTCCSVCAGGSYISGTECNCCRTCQGTSCPDDSYTTNAGACDYSVCPNGCNFNSQGCPNGCMTAGGYCGDGSCNVGETPASCSSDCGGTTITCSFNSYTTSSGACNYVTCPNGCNFDYYGCPSGCMTSTSEGYCGDGICSGAEICPADCESIQTTPSDCGTGCWWNGNYCQCSSTTEDNCGGCDCSSGCGYYDCYGIDGSVCCSVSRACEDSAPSPEPEPEPELEPELEPEPEPEEPLPITGGVIFWDYYYN